MKRGKPMPNRFMLAPLTNQQSHADGSLSVDEFTWLTARATGGFGATMTCGAHVQPAGQAFVGQLGIFGDQLLPGLTRLADAINATGSMSIVQLYHGGNRASKELMGTDPLCPSDDPATGARAMTLGEVEESVEAWIAAAVRAQRAGFDGVEIHGAHGYLVCQFLSSEINHRNDRYGGTIDGRSRFLREIVTGIRRSCGPDFVLGVRLSPERFGMKLAEIRELSADLMAEGAIDFLDLSLWDCFKEPAEPAHAGKLLVEHFTDLDRHGVIVGGAGGIRTPADVRRAIEVGLDIPILGRAAILHHDFPKLMQADPDFTPAELPVTVEHLMRESLSEAFVGYMRNWKGFVAD